MSDQHVSRRPQAKSATAKAWVLDTRELGRSPGASKRFSLRPPAPEGFGLDLIRVPAGDALELELLTEAVVEGVLVSGTVKAAVTAECAACLEPFNDEYEIEVRELFAYPDSATEASTDEDEIHRVVDERVNLEPMVRDAFLLALPTAPTCRPDCPGLCAGCGRKWVELDPQHTHETIDPRWAVLRDRLDAREEEN